MLHKAITQTNTIGEDLRTARRNFGLSQAQLSSLLGLSQARISRWESGREDIPVKHRLRIVDLFLNTRGQISPLIETMLRSNPTLGVMCRKAKKILKASSLVLNAYELEKSDVIGAEYARIFDPLCKNTTDLSMDWCALSYSRDLLLGGALGCSRGFRWRVKMVRVRIEGYDEIVIRRNELVGPSGDDTSAPKVDSVLPINFDY